MTAECSEGVLAKARARRLLRTAPATARALRQQAQISQQDVADALGVTRVSVHHWETGHRLPAGDMAPRYLDFLQKAAGS